MAAPNNPDQLTGTGDDPDELPAGTSNLHLWARPVLASLAIGALIASGLFALRGTPTPREQLIESIIDDTGLPFELAECFGNHFDAAIGAVELSRWSQEQFDQWLADNRDTTERWLADCVPRTD